MTSCPRCDSSIDDEARYCIECGAPQTEEAAEELDEYIQRQARQVAAEAGDADGGTGGGGTVSGNDGDGVSRFVPIEDLTDREQLWRRGCYVFGYGTIVVALTLVPAIGAFFLILGGIAILPPIRRLTAEPLGSPLKREVMVGLYAVLALFGILLFVLL